MNNEHPIAVAEISKNPNPPTASDQPTEVIPSQEEQLAMKDLLDQEPEEYLLSEEMLRLLDDGVLQGLLTRYRLDNIRDGKKPSGGADVVKNRLKEIGSRKNPLHGGGVFEKLSGLITDLKQYQTQSGDHHLASKISTTAKELFPKKTSEIIMSQKAKLQTSVSDDQLGALLHQEPRQEHIAGIVLPPDTEDDAIKEEVRGIFGKLPENSDGDALPQANTSRWTEEDRTGDFGEAGLVAESPSPEQPNQFELDQALASPLDADWKKLQWSTKEPREASPEKIKIFHQVNKDIKEAVNDPSQKWLVDFTADQVTRGFESSTRDIRTKYRAYDFIPAVKHMLDNIKTLPQNQRFSHAEMNTLNKFFHQKVKEKRDIKTSE